MTTRPKASRLALAILATGLLALAGMAATVQAKPGDSASEHRESAKEKGQEMKEKMQELRDGAKKERRHVVALEMAIKVHERLLNRTLDRIQNLTDRLDDGNLTANQTAKLEKRIGHLEDRAAKLTEKIAKLKAMQTEMRAKWAEKRAAAELKHGEDEIDDEEGGDAGESSSSSTSSSETSSSTSSA